MANRRTGPNGRSRCSNGRSIRTAAPEPRRRYGGRAMMRADSSRSASGALGDMRRPGAPAIIATIMETDRQASASDWSSRHRVRAGFAVPALCPDLIAPPAPASATARRHAVIIAALRAMQRRVPCATPTSRRFHRRRKNDPARRSRSRGATSSKTDAPPTSRSSSEISPARTVATGTIARRSTSWTLRAPHRPFERHLS